MAEAQCQILLFSVLRDAAGTDALSWPLPPGPITAGQLLEALMERFPALRPHRPSILIAVDHGFVKPDHPVSPGSEVAFMPPLQGG